MVVVMSPTPEDHPGVSECIEHFFIQALVAQLAVEALDKAVLLRLSWCDVVPGDAGLILPFEDGATSQFSAVVADNGGVRLTRTSLRFSRTSRSQAARSSRHSRRAASRSDLNLALLSIFL